MFGVMILVLFLVNGCKTSEPTTTRAPDIYLASLYNPSKLSLHPEYSIFHENEGHSILYIRAYPSELRFDQANDESEYRAILSFKYKLIALNEGFDGEVVDSSVISYKLGAPDEDKSAFFA